MEKENLPRYSADNLDLLLKGFTGLLSSLSNASRASKQVNASDLVKNLSDVDKEIWDRIKEVFDDSHLYQVYQQGTDPVSILASIYKSFDQSRDELLSMSKEWEAKESSLMAEKEDLQDRVETMTRELANMQFRLRNAESTLLSVEILQQQQETKLKEKDKLISDLQRQDNVLLWEKEKQRAFEQLLAKQAALERDLADTKKEHAKQCEKYEARIEELQDAIKRSQLSMDIKLSHTPESQTMNELKRQVYYIGKELLAAEKELNRLHRDVCGVIVGVEKDFRIIHHNMVENKQFQIQHIDKLATWLSKLQAEMLVGDIATVRRQLPDYYTIPQTQEITPIKIRHKALEKLKFSNGQPVNVEAMVKTMEQDVWDIETNHAAKALEQQTVAVTSDAAHPQLVYDNGKVNTTELMKHFPQLSVKFVQDQYNNFRRYDKNGDGTLDLVEMMTAITATHGHKFTPQEVVDVMSEVDDDQTATLDFFEYIKVAVIILRKTGRSKIFQHDLVKKNKTEISQTCILQ